MYEKLGDLLNEALEQGKIAQEGQTINVKGLSSNVKGQSSNVKGLSSNVNRLSSNVKGQSKSISKPVNKIPTGTVIKQEVLLAFNLFGLPTTANLAQVKQKYHYLLKEIHPDTKGPATSNVSIDDLKKSYEILEKYLLS